MRRWRYDPAASRARVERASGRSRPRRLLESVLDAGVGLMQHMDARVEVAAVERLPGPEGPLAATLPRRETLPESHSRTNRLGGRVHVEGMHLEMVDGRRLRGTGLAVELRPGPALRSSEYDPDVRVRVEFHRGRVGGSGEPNPVRVEWGRVHDRDRATGEAPIVTGIEGGPRGQRQMMTQAAMTHDLQMQFNGAGAPARDVAGEVRRRSARMPDVDDDPPRDARDVAGEVRRRSARMPDVDDDPPRDDGAPLRDMGGRLPVADDYRGRRG